MKYISTNKLPNHLLQTLLLFFVLTASTAAAQPFQVYASNNPPFNYQGADGNVQGIAVDVLKTIMERIDIPVDLSHISIINWPRAVYTTTSTPNHILLSPARTPQREDSFAWVGPLHSFRLGLFARKDMNIVINETNDLQKIHIGVIRDSAPSQILVDQFGVDPKDMTDLSTDNQLFLMLQRRRVDAIPRAEMSAAFWMGRLGLKPENYEMVYVLKEIDLYIALSPMTDPKLIRHLNNELIHLKTLRPDGSSQYTDIVNHHLHTSH